jgi:hypothetical protein
MKRNRCSRLTHFSILLVLCVAIAVSARPTVSKAEKGRTLGDYRFIPVSKIEAPFITTHFRNFTGIAFASDVNFPIIVIPDNPPDTLLALNGDFLFVVANFEYQHAVHPRVALHLAAGGASRVGISSEALLSQGVTALTSGQLGAVVELWRNESVLLSAAADLGYVNGLVIDFIQFAKDIIDGNTRNASLVREDNGARGDAGLRVAWAWNQWSGLTGVGQVGFADLGSLSDEVLWRFAASGSADFGQRGNAPVGVQLSLDVDHLKPQTADVKTAIGVGVGVYYTGREDLNLGLEIDWTRWPLQDWDTVVYPVALGMALRYFF